MGYNYQDAPMESQQEYFGIHTDNKETLQNALKRIEELEAQIEKMKRCVSLVWDFQEIYDEEDIEDFCHNELHTYPQHDEIMEYFKHIENLEKANEWHYVKDELPPVRKEYCGRSELVLVVSKEKEMQYAQYVEKEKTWARGILAIGFEPYAWKEIVLPKEIKEND